MRSQLAGKTDNHCHLWSLTIVCRYEYQGQAPKLQLLDLFLAVSLQGRGSGESRNYTASKPLRFVDDEAQKYTVLTDYLPSR